MGWASGSRKPKEASTNETLLLITIKTTNSKFLEKAREVVDLDRVALIGMFMNNWLKNGVKYAN